MLKPLQTIVLATFCFVSAGYAPGPPAPPRVEPEDVYEFSARSAREAEAILNHPERCSECRPLSGTFAISWEMHFGFKLLTKNSLFEGTMEPIFGPGIAAKFRYAWSDENLAEAANAGQAPYCECAGWTVEHRGSTYFKIETARLFNK